MPGILKQIGMGGLEGDAHMVWMKIMNKLREQATAMSVQPAGHEKIRLSFREFSTQMKLLVEQFGTPVKVYLNRCPMAFNNSGGIWLQGSEDLLNPYYGSEMATCGETIRTFIPEATEGEKKVSPVHQKAGEQK
ncbi:MAG: DUF3347 domain-containing protein [Lentisphaerae bacterium]|nr:MAG: DUF3347 domain-containing protein [Lentisphaerota bacterium]